MIALRPIQVGPHPLTPPTALAPLEGVTDRPFRRWIRSLGGCGWTVTELVSSVALSKAKKAPSAARLDPDEHPAAVQIFGRDPEPMAEAARRAQDLGADAVDLNLGCPSKQVTSGDAGAALMRLPKQAAAIFRAVKAAITIPLTVKMRLGWDDEERNALEIAQLAEAEGAELLVVHGRTRVQLYQGTADWAAVAEVVQGVKLPVLVNGDILTPEHAVTALAQSGAAGVMVGRGVLRDPWLIARVADRLAGRQPREPSLAERRAGLHTYLDLLESDSHTEDQAVGRMKRATGFFTRGVPYGEALRLKVFHSFAAEDIRAEVDRYFDRLEAEGLLDAFTQIHLEAAAFAPGDPRNCDVR